MGEIADAMLDGDMCEWCGEWLGEGDGYVRLCAACQREKDIQEAEENGDR